MMRRSIFLLPLVGFSAPLLATNQAPELTQAVPAIVLDSGGSSFALDLTAHIQDPDVPGTAVRITVRLGTELKPIDLALFDAETPETVANFRHYVDSGAFSSSFFHRSVPDFVIQGGGFRFTDSTTFSEVPTVEPIINEPGVSNVRGTIAMAKVGGDPDSATSQWFINLNDNSANLDEQNGGFTAFGRVLGAGMEIADKVAALPAYDVSSLHPAWTSVPLKDFANPLERAHFVETEMAIIPALTFSASSAEPDLVSATIVDDQLELTPSQERSGSTTVAVTATDLEGGTLEVDIEVTVEQSYVSWRKLWGFSSAAESDPAADPDGDGWTNLLEFAFGGNPVSSSPPAQRPKPDLGAGVTFGHLTYARLNYIAWESGDLKNWTPVWSTGDGFDHPAVHAHKEEDGFQKLMIRAPEAPEAPAQRFWRVSVEAVE